MSMLAAQALIEQMEDSEQGLLRERNKTLQAFSTYTPILIIIASFLSIIITVFFYLKIMSDFRKRSELQDQLVKKDFEISTRLSLIQGLAKKISSGDYKIRVGDEGEDLLGSLSGDLNKMAEGLDSSFTTLSDKEWLQAGIAGLNQQMIGEIDLDILSKNVLEFITEYTNSSIGALYLINSSGDLSLSAGYALSNSVPQHIRIGHGLVGQSAKSLQPLILEDVPEQNFNITFASGSFRPVTVIAIPIMHGTILKGVLELGSAMTFDSNKRIFLDNVSGHIGVSISGAENRRRLQELLEETQSQAEELQMQHSEMENINEELRSQSQKLQVSEEELKVQQEELMQTNTELEERTTLLEEKNQMIEERNQEIQLKARELERTTRYKSEFLANMSHELRTPLNSILLLSRLMIENNEHNLNKDQIEFAQVIQSSGQGLLSLIDEILDLSRIESGKMDIEVQTVALGEITNDLKAIFVPLAKEKKINFTIDISDNTPAFFETDKMRLEQILKNLISNAIKFTSQGFVSMNILKSEQDNNYIIFKVKDSGIGIPSDKQEVIFEAFQQADGSTRRQYGGTGLGLSISRELTKLLGGHIELSSEAGKGSEFRLYLPVIKLAEVAEDEPALSSLAANVNIGGNGSLVIENNLGPDLMAEQLKDDRDSLAPKDKVILIIEDDPMFARTILEFARQKGFKGVVASRGDFGIELASRLRPAGILLDIKLPGKDGFQVMKELKANMRTKNIPVHAMSSMDAKTKSINSGAIDFISKPLAYEQMGEVFKNIETILNNDPKKVLIVEENAQHAQALSYFLENFNITAKIKNDVKQSINALQKEEVTCVILNMGTPYGKSYDQLEEIKKFAGLENIPIIIFTGKNLSRSEEKHIRQYADSIVVKTAHSYQRILDEISLFLHLMEGNKDQHDAGSNFRQLGRLTEILKDKKVLIADDDVRNIFSLSRALEGVGMQIVSAIDGNEALQQLKADSSIDAVLMDMMMPELDGYETMRLIRGTPGFSRLPIIAVTAKAMSGDREKCIDAGASDYITKPIDKDQLLSLLRVWLYDKS